MLIALLCESETRLADETIEVIVDKVKQLLIALPCESEMRLADATIEVILDKVKPMLIALLCESKMRLADETIEVILDKTFLDADVNQDVKIDIAEWLNFGTQNPSPMKIMTLAYLRDPFPSFVFNSKVEEIST